MPSRIIIDANSSNAFVRSTKGEYQNIKDKKPETKRSASPASENTFFILTLWPKVQITDFLSWAGFWLSDEAFDRIDDNRRPCCYLNFAKVQAILLANLKEGRAMEIGIFWYQKTLCEGPIILTC